MRYLKQSTVVTLKLGPFLDEDDGKTAEAGLAIAQADVRLSKNGGAFAQKNDVNAAAHDENGWYGLQINATDTNTLGRLVIAIHETGALPVWVDCTVVTANVWDTLCGADKLEVDLLQMGGVAQSATDLKDFADAGYNPATDKVTGVLLVDGVTTVTGNVGGNVVGTVGSVVGNVGGNVVGTVASVVGSVASVVGNVGGNVVGTVASVVGNLGGNVAGDVVGDIQGDVLGNVVGTVASVVGSVASVVGNVGGNVVGSVGSVLGNVAGSVASVVGNVGGNVVGTVASIVGDLGGDVVGDVQGDVLGNVIGTVASVVGNVGGNVVGTVASVVGAVGSVVGNVGGNVVGTVASVVGNVGGSVASMLAAGRNEVADSVLSRAITNTEAAAPFRSMTGAIAKLVNHVRVVGGNLVVYETDDATPYGTQALTTDAAADPIVRADTV